MPGWEELAGVKGRPEGLAVGGAGVLGARGGFGGVARMVGVCQGWRGPAGLRVRCWGCGRREAEGKWDKEGLGGGVRSLGGAHDWGRGVGGACRALGVVELGVRGLGAWKSSGEPTGVSMGC